MATTPVLLPINPSTLTDPNALAKSNYKTLYQLCQAQSSTVSGDLGPSGANTRVFGTTYTASSRIFVAATGLQSAGVGNNAQITPFVNGVAVAPGNSVTNGPGTAGTGFIVPSGATYEIDFVPSGGSPVLSLLTWNETTI